MEKYQTKKEMEKANPASSYVLLKEGFLSGEPAQKAEPEPQRLSEFLTAEKAKKKQP